MQSKTVFMISPFSHPNIGGVESHIDKLVNFLSSKKYKVILSTYQPLTTQTKGDSYEVNGNLEVHRVNWFGNGWFPKLEVFFPIVFLYLFPGLFYQSLKVYLLKRKEIHVIHAHGFVSAVITKIIAKIGNKRCVVSTHAIYNLEERKFLALLVKWVLRDFDAILAVGEPSRQELINIGLLANKIQVHPNWIDINEYRPIDKALCRREIGLDADDFVVLFLGRMIEKKGVLLVLEAARRTDKDIKFLFAGDGPLAERVIKEAKDNNKIRFLGRIKESEKPLVYNSADLFVAPVTYEEGFATVYLESLSCGTPVLTSKKGCLPYFLTSKVANFIDEVSVEEILKILDNHYINQDALQKKRGLCRDFSIDNFSDNNAKIIMDSYSVDKGL